MVTPEQAERYDVHAINVDEGIALSEGGDVGHIIGFYDDDGDECEPDEASKAIIDWPDVALWTVFDLCDYKHRLSH